jgi:hypothetical protein
VRYWRYREQREGLLSSAAQVAQKNFVSEQVSLQEALMAVLRKMAQSVRVAAYPH